MAIARDSSTGLSASASGATSFTYAHTCAGDDRYLFVYVFDATTSEASVTGVTYNGVSMTKLVSARRGDSDRYIHIFGLVAPATGANNVVVSRTGTTSVMRSGAVSYTGVDQTNPVNDTETYTSPTPADDLQLSISPTTTVDNCIITAMSCFTSGGAGLQSAVSGCVQISNSDINNNWESDPLNVGSAGSKTLTVKCTTAGTTTTYGGICAVALAPLVIIPTRLPISNRVVATGRVNKISP